MQEPLVPDNPGFVKAPAKEKAGQFSTQTIFKCLVAEVCCQPPPKPKKNHTQDKTNISKLSMHKTSNARPANTRSMLSLLAATVGVFFSVDGGTAVEAEGPKFPFQV